jgi:hypothetical protein
MRQSFFTDQVESYPSQKSFNVIQLSSGNGIYIVSNIKGLEKLLIFKKLQFS